MNVGLKNRTKKMLNETISDLPLDYRLIVESFDIEMKNVEIDNKRLNIESLVVNSVGALGQTWSTPTGSNWLYASIEDGSFFDFFEGVLAKSSIAKNAKVHGAMLAALRASKSVYDASSAQTLLSSIFLPGTQLLLEISQAQFDVWLTICASEMFTKSFKLDRKSCASAKDWESVVRAQMVARVARLNDNVARIEGKNVSKKKRAKLKVENTTGIAVNNNNSANLGRLFKILFFAACPKAFPTRSAMTGIHAGAKARAVAAGVDRQSMQETIKARDEV